MDSQELLCSVFASQSTQVSFMLTGLLILANILQNPQGMFKQESCDLSPDAFNTIVDVLVVIRKHRLCVLFLLSSCACFLIFYNASIATTSCSEQNISILLHNPQFSILILKQVHLSKPGKLGGMLFPITVLSVMYAIPIFSQIVGILSYFHVALYCDLIVQ